MKGLIIWTNRGQSRKIRDNYTLNMKINCTVADTCYTDFAKMTGTTIEYLSRPMSVVECAFECQMNSCKSFRNIFFKLYLFLIT